MNRVMLAIGLILSFAYGQVFADTSSETVEPLALRKIMQDLGKNMQAITDGISREDWEQVEEISPQVVDHPQPPFGEKIRILSFVGTDVSRFKGYDGKTHDAARALEDAARNKDGQAVISAFSKLQSACLACHQNFRKPFLEHFYGQE
ncbi:MAG TPA: cytochrome c [Gammaproteobacteria bacterium]